MGFPGGSAGKESTCNLGDLDSTGLGRSPEEEKGYPLQYSGLENSMNCIVHRVAKSQIRLSDMPCSNFPCSSLFLENKDQPQGRYKLWFTSCEYFNNLQAAVKVKPSEVFYTSAKVGPSCCQNLTLYRIHLTAVFQKLKPKFI